MSGLKAGLAALEAAAERVQPRVTFVEIQNDPDRLGPEEADIGDERVRRSECEPVGQWFDRLAPVRYHAAAFTAPSRTTSWAFFQDRTSRDRTLFAIFTHEKPPLSLSQKSFTSPQRSAS